MKFSDIVKGMIFEQGRYEILKKTYTEPKKKGDTEKPARMSVEQLDTIIKADPTTRMSGDNIKKAGTYSPWLIKQYLMLEPEAEYGTSEFDTQMTELQRLYFEDLYKVTDDLKLFDRFKSQLEGDMRDINKLNIRDLSVAVQDFSLEKTKATKSEKEAAAKTYEHPGGEIVYRDGNWTVVKISEQGEIGKDAACFYGGNNLRSVKGETNWCTSAPGLNYFNTYIKDGPMYVIIPNEAKSFRRDDITTGEKSGLPAQRYQFHFPTNQFMDPDNNGIDLIEFLNNNEGLKEYFKPEISKSFNVKGDTENVVLSYPNDAASKYVALYGFEDFIGALPESLESLDIINTTSDKIDLKLPSSINRFKNLKSLHLNGFVSELPKEIGDLKELMFLALPKNPNLKELPEELGNLNNLEIIRLPDSENIKIPETIKNNPDIMIIS